MVFTFKIYEFTCIGGFINFSMKFDISFSLRTSETAYLHEAYAFYHAIRGRCYYTQASKEDKCELMVKKLRYYARFIVVCLLLKKIKIVRDLIKELDKQIIEYGNTYDPDDQVEWTVVVDEVKAFLQAESVIAVIHSDGVPAILFNRYGPYKVRWNVKFVFVCTYIIIIVDSIYQIIP